MPSPLRASSDFRTREAGRVFGLRAALFSAAACDSWSRDHHHVDPGFEEENIYKGFGQDARYQDGLHQDALQLFKARKIKWHGSGSCDTSIVSSQTACLNCFFPFTDDPVALKGWLSNLYPDLAEVLPISSRLEPPLTSGRQPYVTFEWIGERTI